MSGPPTPTTIVPLTDIAPIADKYIQSRGRPHQSRINRWRNYVGPFLGTINMNVS